MVELTEVMLSWRVVTVLAAKVSVYADPSLGREPTATVLPSLNVMFPPVIWSLAFGRSYSTIVSMVCGVDQVSSSQLPALPLLVAHSLLESAG